MGADAVKERGYRSRLESDEARAGIFQGVPVGSPLVAPSVPLHFFTEWAPLWNGFFPNQPLRDDWLNVSATRVCPRPRAANRAKLDGQPLHVTARPVIAGFAWRRIRSRFLRDGHARSRQVLEQAGGGSEANATTELKA